MCFASKVGGSNYFQIKTLNGKHTCGRNYNGRLASSDWISKKIANNISCGKDMRLTTDKYMANISIENVYWTRRKTREEVHGRAILQYAKLRDYYAEILKTNLRFKNCYDKLMELDPELWIKSHSPFMAKSDMLINILEIFNGRILETRDKPILTIFE
ncbi:hypothetical protein Ahy_A03g011160 isoform A [Arachis hypogaea]|uniref:Uncharacterized protein n=1 Tax=Arachis hypogaea TaxID=3818 RepID=A0A445DPU5_ARAHY|nr:hypothetical protein Ahy_A03g011160 isoform A [Arachis hypogaea]